jgi:hypothetical protein
VRTSSSLAARAEQEDDHVRLTRLERDGTSGRRKATPAPTARKSLLPHRRRDDRSRLRPMK